MRPWLMPILALLVTGCGDQRDTRGFNKTLNNNPNDSRPQYRNEARTPEAEALVGAIDEELQQLATLPAAQRRERELGMERRLERAVEVAEGTRLENKAVYYLANWRFTYRDGDGTEALLNRLGGLQSWAMKGFGSRLRVLLLLRQGKIAEAKSLAQNLVEEVPEFSPLLERVTFHETVGAVAPKVAGRNLTGGPDEPVAKRSETWLLYLFVDLIDENNLYLIERYVDALSVLPADQRRLVCVTFESSLLSATTRLKAHPRGGDVDLLWAGAGEQGNPKEWRTAWKLPTQNPHIALLGPGPERTIMAVEVTPETLRQLLAPAPGKK